MFGDAGADPGDCSGGGGGGGHACESIHYASFVLPYLSFEIRSNACFVLIYPKNKLLKRYSPRSLILMKVSLFDDINYHLVAPVPTNKPHLDTKEPTPSNKHHQLAMGTGAPPGGGR